MLSLTETRPQREAILRMILRDEVLSDVDVIADLAEITESYSGSDLKELCKTACIYPIREMVDQKRKEGYRLCDIDMNCAVRPLCVGVGEGALRSWRTLNAP